MDSREPNLPWKIYSHPAHEHELVLCPKKEAGAIYSDICYARGCYKPLYDRDERYACESCPKKGCKFKMHTRCAGIKAQMKAIYPKKDQMEAGELDSSESIHDPAHEHDLVLGHFQGIGDCSLCESNIKKGGEIYTCETVSRFDYCYFSAHKDCCSVKAKIDAGEISSLSSRIYNHPAHSGHKLVLGQFKPATVSLGHCDAYRCPNHHVIKEGEEMYVCEDCSRAGFEVMMHSACARVKAQMEAGELDSSEKIHNPAAHKHDLLVLGHFKGIGDVYNCSICENKFKKGDEIYTCETSRFDLCRFSIHKACSSIKAEVDSGEAELPEMITYPDHEGGLVLVLYGEYPTKSFTCSVCRIKRHKEGEEIYVCENSSHSSCGFSMDTACSSIKGKVYFSGHDKDHPLVFLERISSDHRRKCDSCGGELSNKPIFWCTSCEHGLHLLCGPLPTSIPYHFAGYDLNLILKDTLLDGVDPEDSWCDICEERRDPGKCVYRSEDPSFTAATDCLLPQIVRALKGHSGEVQLRTVKGHLPGVVRPFAARGSPEQEVAEQKRLLADDTEEVIEEASEVANNNASTISLEQFGKSLTEEELKHLLTLRSEQFSDGGQVRPFQFSDEAFELFKEHVAIKGEQTFNSGESWMDGDTEFIKVGDDLVDTEFVSLYQQLIEKHGAFTADSPLSQAVRALLLSLFLLTIRETLGLQTHQITGGLLCALQYSWKCLFRDVAGFRLQFALDNLEKVARTWYALRLINVRDGITKDLTERIQHLMKEIEVDKPKAEALGVQYGRAKKESAFGKQCPLKLSKLQWKDAGEFLGLDPEE